MSLNAFNKTGAPLALAAGGVTLPASAAPPARGPVYNVSSELAGLSAGNYTALEAQRAAGDVEFQWSDAPEFAVGSLIVGAPSLSTAGATQVVWSPENPAGDDALRFTDADHAVSFKQAFDLCRTLADAGADVTLYCDNEHSTAVDYLGAPTTTIGTSAAEPGGVWNTEGIKLGGGFRQGASITFDAGCVITPTQGDIWFVMGFGDVINEDVANTPLRPASGWGICQGGGNIVKFSVGPGAAPLIMPQPAAPFWYLCFSANGLGGVGDAGGGASSDPIIDALGRTSVIAAEGSGVWFTDNAMMDSVGNATADFRGPWRLGRNNDRPGVQPGMGEALAIGAARMRQRQRFNLKIPIENGQRNTTASPITESGQEMGGDGRHFDTTAHVVSDTLTYTDDPGGGNSLITGADFSAIKANDVVVVAGSVSNNDTFTANLDGDGTSLELTGVVLTTEAPVASTVTRSDIRALAPMGSPWAGQRFWIFNEGPGDVILDGQANARNIGGALDAIEQPTIPPGIACYMSNGGLDGTNVATWRRYSMRPAPSAAYTPTNVTPDRAYDADTVAVAELADIVGTLIADLQSAGLLS